MYITADDEISFYYPIDNRNGNKKVGLIRAYFIYSFYNVEKDEKIHLKNRSPILAKRGCYTKKDIEKVSSGKAKLREHTMHRFGAIYYTTLIHTNTTKYYRQTNKTA